MGKHHLEMMEYNAAYAMLTCHANTDKLKDEPPSEFLKRAMKVHHDTVLEHIYLTYEVNNLSRACLQELARHRHISLSVESTRHTLKKKFEQKDFSVPEHIPVVSCGDISHLLKDKTQNDVTLDEVLIGFIYTAYIQNPDVPADKLKYFLPEFWTTNLVMTANVREMRHIISLRTSPAALKEFQDLARKLVEVVPERFRYLLEDCVQS